MLPLQLLADAGSAMPQFEEGILDSEQLVTSYDTAESVDVISSQRPAAAAGKPTATTAAAPSLLRHATPKKPVAVAGNIALNSLFSVLAV